MLTFNQLHTESAAQMQDSSAETLTIIKRAINQGAQKFGAILNREWRNTERTFSIVADQQFYQMPEDCIRIKSIQVEVGGVVYPLRLIEDEDTWNQLTMYRTSETSAVPECFYVKGDDQFGIYPIPSTSLSNKGTLSFERRMAQMSADDYTTGTITVANASAAIVGAGTTFTAQMVGRTLIVEDAGDQHGVGYRISAFTDATNITLENTYAGLSGASKTYRIGEVPDLPEEYHENLVDYACYRCYRRRNDTYAARDMKAAFDEGVMLCKQNYGSKTASQYYSPVKLRGGYVHSPREYHVE